MAGTPDAERLRRSRNKHRDGGGVVTTVCLSKEATEAAQALIQGGYGRDRRQVIERALVEVAKKICNLD